MAPLHTPRQRHHPQGALHFPNATPSPGAPSDIHGCQFAQSLWYLRACNPLRLPSSPSHGNLQTSSAHAPHPTKSCPMGFFKSVAAEDSLRLPWTVFEDLYLMVS